MIKQTTAQSIGRAGERWFRQLLPSEWLFQQPEEDIGLDGRVIVGSSTSTGDLEFGVQIKSKQRWSVRANTLTVRGLRRDTIKYWGSRLHPTMIVLYDVTDNCGYYGWLFDVLANPHRLLASPHDTITLKLPATNRLTGHSWPTIRGDVETHYSNVVNALYSTRLEINTLPAIHSMAMCLNLLLNAQMVKPQHDHEEKLLAIGELTAHKEVILSLRQLTIEHRIDADAPNAISAFGETYRRLLGTFIGNLDELTAAPRGASVMHLNREQQTHARPILIRMLSELLVQLSDHKR